MDEGGEVATPQAGIHGLRFDLQNLGQGIGVIRLVQLRPGFTHHLDVGLEVLEVFEKELCGVAAVGIVRRAR